tara:strand:+ start:762 stop:890 length:129 start_codon:yes stop_codon:yes gene_type:complete
MKRRLAEEGLTTVEEREDTIRELKNRIRRLEEDMAHILKRHE